MCLYKVMKHLVPLLILAFAHPALARINETIEQCQTRYGDTFKQIEPDTYNATGAGFFIFLKFIDGRCAILGYSKLQNDALGQPIPISPTEQTVLLDNNFGQGKYKRQPGGMNDNYANADASLLAVYDVIKHNLIFTTRKAVEAETKAQQEADSKKMEGL